MSDHETAGQGSIINVHIKYCATVSSHSGAAIICTKQVFCANIGNMLSSQLYRE